MIGAYRHKTLANNAKVKATMALFPEFRKALGCLSAQSHRAILDGQGLMHWRVMSKGSLGFATALSARQMKSAQNMVHAAVSSWQENMAIRVRELITGSDLPEARKTVLYRINARKEWWAQQLELPWKCADTGELAPASPQEAAANPESVVVALVDSEDLALARRLAKAAQKRCRFPNLRRVNTLVLDSPVAKVSRAGKATDGGQIGWWVKVSTLRKGKPVQIPLATNPYFESQLQKAEKLCGAVQIHLPRDTHGHPHGIEVSLLAKTPDAHIRTSGRELGIDFGLTNALFATSEGQLLGRRMLAHLAKLDPILTAHAAKLQKAGVSLKGDPYYRQLQTRISGYATNEIGRLLNRMAAREGEASVAALIVEKLDFRGGGLSRRMNRMLTCTGRSVLKARLSALTTKHGIEVVEVPSPYTSQECLGCGYTHAKNRSGKVFHCRFCGRRLHADVNAARVIKSRRSRPTPDHTGARSRSITLQILDRRHRQRWNWWNLPVNGAVPDIAGAPGHLAKAI